MVDTEIWLRLMSISSLYGDDMVRIAHWVAKQSHIDAVVLQQTGLTLRQAQRFLSFHGMASDGDDYFAKLWRRVE
mgnify:CR=1 FL=1